MTGPVERAADSAPMGWLARGGLTARALVYGLMGLLALLVARGGSAHVDQKGALAQVLHRPLGPWVVGFLAAGFAGYSLWRLSEAAFGVAGQGRAKGPRLQSGVRAVVYGFLAYTAYSVLRGSGDDQGSRQRDYAAKLMAHPAGRVLLGAVGVVVVAVGLFMVFEGLTAKFMRYFPAGSLSSRMRTVVRAVGGLGTVARGLVFGLTGALVVVAAWTYDPAKASGLDGALKTLRDQPYGVILLSAAAGGLLAFGCYGLCEARFRRV